MWNSGGKNVWKSAVLGPLAYGNSFLQSAGNKLYGPQVKEGHVSYPVPELFPLAKPQFETAFGQLPQLEKDLGDVGSRLMSGIEGLDIGVGEDALRREMLGQVLPGYAARGLATSGQGINVEQDVESKLAQTRFERAARRQELLQQAAQGLAVLKALPFQLRQQLLDVIVRQGGTAVPMAQSGSIIEQISGLLSGFGRAAAGTQTPGGGGGR